jgi:hypothetical protein
LLSLWPLLLLLIPALIWFLLARLVLVRVPDNDGKLETVKRMIARRKDKRWFVDIEKQLDEYLVKHGQVVVDFRGGLIKDAKKTLYSGETILGADEPRYALVNKNRLVTWLDNLEEQVSQAV